MRKLFIVSILVLSAHFVFAQDLLPKIPATANVVAGINTGKLLQLMPAEEWNNSNFGKKLLEMSSKDPGGKLNSINDIGINLAGITYYFHTENDSLHYNCILAPISDAIKFDALFKDRPFTQFDNNTRIIADPDSTGFMMWNGQQLLYIKGILKDQYFNDPAIALRHGLKPPYYYDTTAVVDTFSVPKFEETAPVVDTVITEAPVEEPKSKPVKEFKSKATKKPVIKNKKGSKTKAAKVKKPEPVEKEETETAADQPAEIEDAIKTVDSTYNGQSAYNDYDKDYAIKKSLAAACTQVAIKDLFAHNPVTSIAANPQYMKSVDANAVASVWVDQPTDLYYNLVPSNFMYGKGLSNGFLNRSNNSWYKNFTAKIFLEEKQLRLSSAIELTDEMVAMQQKMLNRKLNKKFLDYINSDSLLGYMTWAMDTKAYLENFPKMLENAYGSMGLSGDEYSLATELFSFIVDEDAISQLVKGDGIVLFNGLYQQQTTYTDYVYDENYKATPVEKTKTDTLPRFLLMLSSDENNFERKLISYGIKKEKVKQREGFYEVTIPSSPVNIFFTNKDGIFFLTNSVADMKAISSGSFKANISKQEKKFVLDHNYTLFINPSKISGQIATTEIGAAESLSSAINTFGKMGIIRGAMNPVNANVMSGELTMDVPANNRNSLKYIFDIFDSFIK